MAATNDQSKFPAPYARTIKYLGYSSFIGFLLVPVIAIAIGIVVGYKEDHLPYPSESYGCIDGSIYGCASCALGLIFPTILGYLSTLYYLQSRKLYKLCPSRMTQPPQAPMILGLMPSIVFTIPFILYILQSIIFSISSMFRYLIN